MNRGELRRRQAAAVIALIAVAVAIVVLVKVAHIFQAAGRQADAETAYLRPK